MTLRCDATRLLRHTVKPPLSGHHGTGGHEAGSQLSGGGDEVNKIHHLFFMLGARRKFKESIAPPTGDIRSNPKETVQLASRECLAAFNVPGSVRNSEMSVTQKKYRRASESALAQYSATLRTTDCCWR